MCGMAFAQTKSAPKKAAPATTVVPAEFRVKLATTKGDIVIDIHKDWAPRGAERLYSLVRGGFFTGAPFFRVIPGFMAQFGISMKADQNKMWESRTLADDKSNGQSNKRGMLTFATTGRPNSRGTQLFINYKDNSFLDAQGFVPIGEVVEGMDIAEQLYSGYGDTANKEGEIESGGQAYIDRYMPKIDKIVSATILPAAAKQ